MSLLEELKHLECVQEFKKELDFLEYYLLESPFKYKGTGKAIKPTIEELRKWYNRTIETIMKNYIKSEEVDEE